MKHIEKFVDNLNDNEGKNLCINLVENGGGFERKEE